MTDQTTQETGESLEAAAGRIVRDEVRYCVSALVHHYSQADEDGDETLSALHTGPISWDDFGNEIGLQSAPIGDTGRIAVWYGDEPGENEVCEADGDDWGVAVGEWFEEMGGMYSPGTDPFDDFRGEVYEHWIVSNWLAARLRDRGETVEDWHDLTIWARCTTGQMITMDGVIRDIAEEFRYKGVGK
jgi:hypothetical protein